jgi:hypothetical protein
MQQRGQGALNALEKGEGQGGWVISCCTREGYRGKELISTQTFSKQRLERQKGQQWVGDKLLPAIRQIGVHKAHLLSQ